MFPTFFAMLLNCSSHCCRWLIWMTERLQCPRKIFNDSYIFSLRTTLMLPRRQYYWVFGNWKEEIQKIYFHYCSTVITCRCSCTVKWKETDTHGIILWNFVSWDLEVLVLVCNHCKASFPFVSIGNYNARGFWFWCRGKNLVDHDTRINDSKLNVVGYGSLVLDNPWLLMSLKHGPYVTDCVKVWCKCRLIQCRRCNR